MANYAIYTYSISSVADAITKIISKLVLVGWTDDTGGVAHSAADSQGRVAYVRLTTVVNTDTYLKVEVSNSASFDSGSTITKYAYITSAMSFPMTVYQYANRYWTTFYFGSDSTAAYRTAFGLYNSIHTAAEDDKPIINANPRTSAGGTASTVLINNPAGKWYAFGGSGTEVECGVMGYNQSGNWNTSAKTVPARKIYINALIRTGTELIGGYLYDARMVPNPALNAADVIHDVDDNSTWYVLAWYTTGPDNICVRVS